MGSYKEGYDQGFSCYYSTPYHYRAFFRVYDYARVNAYGKFLCEQKTDACIPAEWCRGFVDGWKWSDESHHFYEEEATHEEQEETPSFVQGVLSGYHYYGECGPKKAALYDEDDLLLYIGRKITDMKEEVVPAEWRAGFLAGWQTRKKNETFGE